MTKRNQEGRGLCCEVDQMPKGVNCCQVDAVVTIDGRGQIVLPKELREKAQIKAGDKFVIISNESGGKMCCIFLVKVSDFAETVRGMLGPVMKDIVGE